MTVRNLSPATQRSYLHAVSKFSRYFGRSPDRLGLEDVRAFQVHLVSTGWVADFTYVATWIGFVYVAFVIDALARRIVGWRASHTAEGRLRARRPRAGVARSQAHGQSAVSTKPRSSAGRGRGARSKPSSSPR